MDTRDGRIIPADQISMLPPEDRPYVQEMGHHPTPAQRAAGKVGRNELCPCGSGRKFKKCCEWRRGKRDHRGGDTIPMIESAVPVGGFDEVVRMLGKPPRVGGPSSAEVTTILRAGHRGADQIKLKTLGTGLGVYEGTPAQFLAALAEAGLPSPQGDVIVQGRECFRIGNGLVAAFFDNGVVVGNPIPLSEFLHKLDETPPLPSDEEPR